MVGSPGLIECGCGCVCVCVGGGLHYVDLPLVSIYKTFSDGGFPWANRMCVWVCVCVCGGGASLRIFAPRVYIQNIFRWWVPLG